MKVTGLLIINNLVPFIAYSVHPIVILTYDVTEENQNGFIAQMEAYKCTIVL
jgi:hypothetical protein